MRKRQDAEHALQDREGLSLVYSPQTLRRLRHRAGWSQRSLAAQLGTTQPVVSRWERGLRVPPAAVWQHLLTALVSAGGVPRARTYAIDDRPGPLFALPVVMKRVVTPLLAALSTAAGGFTIRRLQTLLEEHRGSNLYALVRDAEQYELLHREQDGSLSITALARAIASRGPGEVERVDAIRAALRAPRWLRELEWEGLPPGTQEMWAFLLARERDGQLPPTACQSIARVYRSNARFLREEELLLSLLMPLEEVQNHLTSAPLTWQDVGIPFTQEGLAFLLDRDPWMDFTEVYHLLLALEQHGMIETAPSWPLFRWTETARSVLATSSRTAQKE